MGAISGKTYLTRIPHERGEITFQHPSFKGTYGSLAQQIDADGLQRPTSAQTASLVYDAFQILLLDFVKHRKLMKLFELKLVFVTHLRLFAEQDFHKFL